MTAEQVKERGASDEFERLVALAEDLHEKHEAVRRRLESYRLLQASLLMFGIAGVAWVTFFHVSDESHRPFFLAAVLSFTALYAFAFETIIRRTKQRAYPDRNALKSILALIRETEAAISKLEKWSALDRAQLQIRLSRLELESDK